MSILIGVGLGAIIGLVPGGNPALAVWLASGLPAPAIVGAGVSAYVASNLQLGNPQATGNLTAMATEARPNANLINPLIKVKLAYFISAFALAVPLYWAASLVLTMGPALAWLLLAGATTFYVWGPDPLKARHLNPNLKWVPLLQAGAVGGTTLACFWFAKQVEIANPVYIVIASLFLPWHNLLGWKVGNTRPIKDDIDREGNPWELFLATPPFALMSGWNAPMTAFIGRRATSAKDQLRNGSESLSKRTLLTDSIAEGLRLGLAAVPGLVGQANGLSEILEPLRPAVELANHSRAIVWAVIASVGLTLGLSRLGVPKLFTGNSKAIQIATTGTLLGTVWGNAGLYGLPLLALGLCLNRFLVWTLQEEPQLNYWDPNCVRRARATAFIFPILFM